jgi:hypothetical protein
VKKFEGKIAKKEKEVHFYSIIFNSQDVNQENSNGEKLRKNTKNVYEVSLIASLFRLFKPLFKVGFMRITTL